MVGGVVAEGSGSREALGRAPSSGNNVRTFHVLPLRLFVHHGAPYLHAWKTNFQAVMPLNLHRMVGLKVTDEVLPTPPRLRRRAD